MSLPTPRVGFSNERTARGDVDLTIEQLCNLDSAPAFVRRGQDVEEALNRLHGHCRRVRAEMLEMVHLRLRQWAAVAVGPDDWSDRFDGPVAPLWSLANAPTEALWADRPASTRRRRAVARDLIGSLTRFNRRWSRHVEELNLDPINTRIEAYNRYYLIEKELLMGSARLASHFFRVHPLLRGEHLLERHPLLPMLQARG
ncbi:hypothetical protein [Tautonia rosea]|uniref:hypothetical protein n=1 Tax=Tautonia rosea TaxID=2728037 RepID=UPI001476322E|nr:hypothetical protein [Tautonia rosea]